MTYFIHFISFFLSNYSDEFIFIEFLVFFFVIFSFMNNLNAFQRIFFVLIIFNRYHPNYIDWCRNQRISLKSYRYFVGLCWNAKWSKRTYFGISSSRGYEEVNWFRFTGKCIAFATTSPGLCQDAKISS